MNHPQTNWNRYHIYNYCPTSADETAQRETETKLTVNTLEMRLTHTHTHPVTVQHWPVVILRSHTPFSSNEVSDPPGDPTDPRAREPLGKCALKNKKTKTNRALPSPRA